MDDPVEEPRTDSLKAAEGYIAESLRFTEPNLSRARFFLLKAAAVTLVDIGYSLRALSDRPKDTSVKREPPPPTSIPGPGQHRYGGF